MESLKIEAVDRKNGDEIIIGFSDGTVANFTVQELSEMRRFRRTPAEDKGPKSMSITTEIK